MSYLVNFIDHIQPRKSIPRLDRIKNNNYGRDQCGSGCTIVAFVECRKRKANAIGMFFF